MLMASNRLQGDLLPEGASVLFTFGLVVLTVGAGFLVSSAISYLLSQRLGLLVRPLTTQLQWRRARTMTRRLLSYAFPFMDSFDPLAQAPDTAAIDDTLQMDEETFRGFYNRTSGMLWAYVARATGDASAADDLLQEAYYRVLRTPTVFESDDHRRNYLFRVATNLIRDRYRRPRLDNAQLPENGEGDIPRRRRSRAADTAARRFAARDGATEPARARNWCGSPTARDRHTRKLPARSV